MPVPKVILGAELPSIQQRLISELSVGQDPLGCGQGQLRFEASSRRAWGSKRVMPCRVHFRTRVQEEALRAVRCKARPNHLFNPTLDRSVVSLPLHSFAVKRGLTER